jgi:hypothetical protein
VQGVSRFPPVCLPVSGCVMSDDGATDATIPDGQIVNVAFPAISNFPILSTCSQLRKKTSSPGAAAHLIWMHSLWRTATGLLDGMD